MKIRTLIKYSFIVLLMSCQTVFHKKNQKITCIRSFDKNYFSKTKDKDLTVTMLVDSIKKYPDDIWILNDIPKQFCDSIFIIELIKFNKDRTKCANIISGRESSIPRYNKTNVENEVNLLIKRINLECDTDRTK